MFEIVSSNIMSNSEHNLGEDTIVFEYSSMYCSIIAEASNEASNTNDFISSYSSIL